VYVFYNVQLAKVIIVFPSNKWVALTKAVYVLCQLVCVWSTIRQAVSTTFALHKVVR